VSAEDIDVSDDIKAIFAGTEVSEEFITKATEVYTAAILSKVNEQLEAVDAKFDESLSEEVSTVSEELVERVDTYLDYVVEQWMDANSVAIERGLKAEIVESFMSGLKGLFETHYIDIPEDAVDVAEELADKVDALESAINEEIEKNIELSNKLKNFEREFAFAEVSEGLTDTQVAKLQSLSEAVEFEDVKTYKNKIATLRESYFPTKTSAGSLTESVTLDEEPVGDEVAEKQVPVEMAAYMTAITRGIKK
jgi:galactose-1-phosphate uridylyltransferase